MSHFYTSWKRQKTSILDIWQFSEYVSIIYYNNDYNFLF